MKRQTNRDTTASFLEESLKTASPKKAAPQEYTVVKRSGALVPFHRDRILKAIEAAFRDTKKTEVLDKEQQESVNRVTDLVIKQLLSLASKGTLLTVEGIQDMVEVTLMKNGFHDVARDYIIYRDNRKVKREGSFQNLKIYRKDKTTPARFNPMKIASSIERAFRTARNIESQSPEDVIQAVSVLTSKIVSEIIELSGKGETLYIDMIEDRIEQELMAHRYFDVAKSYILHRFERAKLQETFVSSHSSKTPMRQFEITTSEHGRITLTEMMLRSRLSHACRGLEDLVNVDDLLETSLLQYYEGMKEKEVDLANIFSAKSKIEKEPAYSLVASRLLLDALYREAIGTPASDPSLNKAHKQYFKKYLKKAISYERVSPKLLDFDLDLLADAMDLQRDDLFGYLGLQTLYDRYFIHHEQKRLETPQIFWMRVAMGLCVAEGEKKNERAIEFYHVLSQFLFTSSTPTLFNSGTLHSQLSSCYLSTVMDDLHHIFKVIADDAQLSKWAGGIGNDWTSVRATGSKIKGTNGTSQGVIPFLKVANDTAVAVNQCFSPETELYTHQGIKQIAHIQKKDLVLGISGQYREVQEVYAYNQQGPMLRLELAHSSQAIEMTDAHPFYAISQESLKNLKAQWIDAKDLKKGDYIARVIPQEVIQVFDFEEEDALIYGMLLKKAQVNEEALWTFISSEKEEIELIAAYLKKRGLRFSQTMQDEMQISWSSSKESLKEGTEGEAIESQSPSFAFQFEDLYGASKEKRIAPRFSHLPFKQTESLLRGLLQKERNGFSLKTSSKELIETSAYQALRLGIFSESSSDLLHIREMKASSSEQGFIHEGCLFTQVVDITPISPSPFVYDLKVEGDESYMTTSGLAHNGGKRKGAMCAYLETWHLDIEDFLELRKNTGDERRRTHDMNTANWIPDLFMKRVRENGMWTLFSPSDVPDLHDLYGKAFEKRYTEYEAMADQGQIKLFKRVEALQLWRKMLSMLFETGHPWITFKDPSNIRSPQDHVGVVHSSNLCTEILLNTSAKETAVCNLGSINLAKHVTKDGLNQALLASTIRTAIRMLDNVIDINFYPTIEAKTSNLRHRPIGLGIMGFQDALYTQNISYASHEAVLFADQSMEMISYYAILASTELAKEKGVYETYKGSKWDRGFLPIDTIDLLEKERGVKVDIDRKGVMDWSIVRKAIQERGMRNSNTMAIAPTATIANITGVIPSNEPLYKHLFVKSNLSGEFTVINPYLVEKLKELRLWDEEMIDDLKYFDGSIQEIERIPQETKRLFLNAFEIEPEWIIECAARRQKWIDMGQSLNLYLAEPSGKKLHQMYMLGWEKGLKTQYYLRSLGATQIEKSTVDINKRGLQPRWMKNKSASDNILIEREDKPKACTLGEECESCQ